MPEHDNILSTHEEQGTFTVYTKREQLRTWSVITAKGVNEAKSVSFTKFLQPSYATGKALM